MELKIIRGMNNIGRELLEIRTTEARVVVGFGEDVGTGEISESVNPMIEGLTCGTPSYNGIFILRNPENSNIVNYAIKKIPIFMPKKLKNSFEIYCDFKKIEKNNNIIGITEDTIQKIRNLEITSYVIDYSNFNTHILCFKDCSSGKKVVVSGDFRNYDGKYEKRKLDEAISLINSADYLVIEGKFLGKYGLDYSSGKILFDKLKNIMKFYKQVFVIQSETDMITASNMYNVAMKTKMIFIENTLLCNYSTALNGSGPNPITTKKVYSYSPLVLNNEDFEFKRKYVNPFYINNANQKMKKEKYVMNITKDMFQDMQIFNKEKTFYDACVILAQWKGSAVQDKELEEFINVLKKFGIDYYELYSHGQINFDVIQKIISKLKPNAVIPLDFSFSKDAENLIDNFKVLSKDEIIKI
ncbi:MAG: hypothetical protein HFJ45_02790 [Clostridia bacterium]|nr:hypothetical protein [Clostridia bacterium]